MTRGWVVVLVVALAGAGAAVRPIATERVAPRTMERPVLALLTSLPLMFGERFSIERPRIAAVERIERHYRIVPIAVADQASLAQHTRLLMAHPRAQPAEVLVELDAWVRRGGRVVLLADPALRWESERPLGDPLRPPPDFVDTGLLDHWGLRIGTDAKGAGRLRAVDRRCVVAELGLVARCTVGKGRASVIADADFMMGEGGDAAHRLDLVMAEMSRG